VDVEEVLSTADRIRGSKKRQRPADLLDVLGRDVFPGEVLSRGKVGAGGRVRGDQPLPHGLAKDPAEGNQHIANPRCGFASGFELMNQLVDVVGLDLGKAKRA
jgi:hypothetical protein